MKKHFKIYKNEYISVFILLITTLALLIVLLQLWNIDFTIPLKYDGLDETSTLVNAKLFSKQLWCMSTNSLGVPFSVEYYDFTVSVFHNFDLLTLKFFVMITGNAAVAFNLEFLSIFFLVAIISYFVMRELKISNWISICASLTFSFMPYLFMRGTEHLVLSTYYFIPLSVLLCIWIFERDDILTFNRQFFKNKRNYVIILFTLLIANNGITYYPFFTCFILIVTAISKTIKSRKPRYIMKSLFTIGLICLFMFINMIPVIINHIQNGANTSAIVRGGFSETEIYGLKIVQLFIPVSDHGISQLSQLINGYKMNSPFVNENISSYIGIMGICGFIFLMLVLFSKKNSETHNRLVLLSEMNLFMVLLGTSGGICTIFSILVSDLLRAYNRISIFIGFVCILAFAIGLDFVYKKYKKKWIIALGVIFTLFCIFEQFPDSYLPSYEINAENYLSDEKMVKQLENEVSDGAMIFELPYHAYPEGGAVNAMMDYQLFIGYIHSNNLKWSYGSIKGREGDEWNKNVAGLGISDMISVLKESKFEAIYIDRRAYDNATLNQLESELGDALDREAVVSDNSNLSYFILK